MRKICLMAAMLLTGVLAAPASPAHAAATCGGLAVTITGTAGDDTITGTQFPDVISAEAGNDVVSGLGEADVVCLGPGNDVFNGGAGDDLVVADATADGADTIIGGDGRDRVDYGARTTQVNVSLDGLVNDGAAGEGDSIGADVESLSGGSAGDVLTGSPSGGLQILGNDGNDTINSGGGGFYQLVGGAGDDFINAGTSTDAVSLLGGDGDDTITGGAGDDTLSGKAGTDTLNGGGGNDRLAGDDNPNDTVGGADTLNGGAGDDILQGHAGNDTLQGGTGNDQIDAGAGNDVIVGGPGDDRIDGSDGDDQSIAESTPDGADVFFGEAGTDTMSYSLRTTAVAVTPDDRADDGAFNEGDNVASTVENITGGQGGDFLFGNDLPNRLFGGNGSDSLNAVDGVSGNDVVDGAQGTGTDTCTADPGDTIRNCP
ncbi:calcium-binding protein [Actinoallomurus bryophytorum]|uniref:Hemolysin type calcium-binding protein n=1 Tax=Actinoallomurus bryophytorum TaxID=1490222 RepID=A0A543CTF4_9ACTN|nr:calcium-binding protein [Actinoallomurus bryophytorum]TQM00390.1 hemolysin type calcium-binding protein [Actinoallomurus bryophytorum]